MTKMSNIELWADGAMIARGISALAALPDTQAQREAADRMFRVEARAVDAQERCDDAERRRDQALEEQRQAQAVVDAARASLISQLCERADDLGRRLDAFERKRVRNFLDSLPDPDSPNQGGELSPIGPVTPPDQDTPRQPAGVGADDTNAADQIPEPKDPSGTALEL
jgi:hypothetical protein